MRRNREKAMAKSGKTTGDAYTEASDFSLRNKKKLRAQRKEWVLASSENLHAEFTRLQDKIDWDALRQASNEDQVNAALSEVHQHMRERLPTDSEILAAVRDADYPKIRPIRFLSESCALARTYPNSGYAYSARYSRDLCYRERKRRGPAPKPMTNVQYWVEQSKLGQKVPPKYLRQVNKLEAREEARTKAPTVRQINPQLTYVDIPENIGDVKKKRTTVWLPETTVAKLKKLSAVTGAPVAELFRRAVEAYLNNS